MVRGYALEAYGSICCDQNKLNKNSHHDYHEGQTTNICIIQLIVKKTSQLYLTKAA